jgi:predicted nucleotidyltransferase
MLERLLHAAGFLLETRLTNIVRPSELLERRYREVIDVITGYPLVRAWVFGSVARGDDRPDSDLDLLVELAPGASVVDCVGLEDDLEAVLGCPVDVITTKELESNDLFQRRVKRHRRELTIAA